MQKIQKQSLFQTVFNYIPKDYEIPADLDYFHITTNNTIYGTEIRRDIDSPVPLIADMSSDIFSRPVDVSKYACIYGGAQKNLAPSGVSFAIVKNDALGKVSRTIPTMLDYRKFHEIRTDILDANLAVLKDHDIILSPVTSCMPVLNSEEDTKGPENIEGESVEQLIGFCQTWLQNMTGNPAASVPAGLGSNNLPIGIQVVGRRYFDEDVYRVAYKVEQMMPWSSYYNKIVV